MVDPLEGLRDVVRDIVRAVDATSEPLDDMTEARVLLEIEAAVVRGDTEARRRAGTRRAGRALVAAALAGLVVGALLLVRGRGDLEPVAVRGAARAGAGKGAAVGAATDPKRLARETAAAPAATPPAGALRPFALGGSQLAGRLALLDRDSDRLDVPEGGMMRARFGDRGAVAVFGAAELRRRAGTAFELELRGGRVVARAGGELVLHAGGAAVVAQRAVFAVAVDTADERPRVAVASGTVWVRAGGERRELTAGASVQVGDWRPVRGGDLERLLDREAALLPAGGASASTSVSTPVSTPVSIDAPPHGADAFVDGQWLGRTPIAVSLAPGIHEVALQDGRGRRIHERLAIGSQPVTFRRSLPARTVPSRARHRVTQDDPVGPIAPAAGPARPPLSDPALAAHAAAVTAAELYRQAEIRLREGRGGEAEALLHRIVQEFAGEPLAGVAAFDLALTCYRDGRYAEAARFARIAREASGPLAGSAERLENRALRRMR